MGPLESHQAGQLLALYPSSIFVPLEGVIPCLCEGLVFSNPKSAIVNSEVGGWICRFLVASGGGALEVLVIVYSAWVAG